jgi:hypothetical protein
MDNTWSLLSGLVIGGIGVGLFIYGKKQLELKCLFAGAALCVLPYIVASVGLQWLLTGGCLGGLYTLSRLGGAQA